MFSQWHYVEEKYGTIKQVATTSQQENTLKHFSRDYTQVQSKKMQSCQSFESGKELTKAEAMSCIPNCTIQAIYSGCTTGTSL